jgi:hypothetical protein
MKTTYGTAASTASRAPATTRLVFHDGPLELRWAHCSATADFLGELFAGLARQAELDANEARHSISYLANELLENAVKFRAPGDVVLEASLHDSTFEIRLSNLVSDETSIRFQALLKEIMERDPGELLIERIEANAADDSATGSGLGILTLMNDYGVQMGWTFEDTPGGLVRLETQASVSLS